MSKYYGDQKAVNRIAFNVSKGEVVGFLGPNGAGKSTTMKMLTTYIAPDDGAAAVCGFDIGRQALEVRRSIGYLPEHNPLYPEMYMREYLHFSGRAHGVRGALRRRIDDMIALTGLERERHKKIGALSKGYRQRVGLAQALLHDPEVLILDEPTTGLDPNQIVEIRELIQATGREKTVILSTHIMQEVEAICDRVLIIHQGGIVADDATGALLRREGGQDYRLRLRDPASEEALQSIQGVRKVFREAAHWRLRAADDRLPEHLFYWAAQQDNPIMELQPVGESLESVFQQLTLQPSSDSAEA